MKRKGAGLYQAFKAVSNINSGQIVIEFLEEQLSKQRDKNDSELDVTLLRWGQGRAQTLKEVLNYFYKADDNISLLHRENNNDA